MDLERKLETKEILLLIKNKCKNVKGLKQLRVCLVKSFSKANRPLKPSDLKEFSYKIGNSNWRGYLYLKRNNLMGTIFSLWDNKVFIVRGFPKIRYSLNSRVRDRYCIAEEKLDGTCIGVWAFPDGTIMGKTRMTPRWNLGSKRAGAEGSWKAKFEQTEDYGKVYELAREGYLVFTELYGYKNPGEFVKYSIPYGIKVIGIVDMQDYYFLPRENVEILCERFGLKLPSIYFKGELSSKEVQRIEFELEKEVRLNGMEGVVGKYWDEKDGDTYFCKLKTEKIKEACWKLSHSLIPAIIIRKAIKKAVDENPGERKIKVLLPFVIDELKEEYDESMLEASMSKIKAQRRYATTPSSKELKTKILEGMKEIKELGVDIENPKNKSKVLSGLHNRLGDINGRTLFKIYLELLLEFKGKW